MANNKVVLGNETLIDLTSDTVDAAHLASGYTAHNSAGEAVTGTMEPELYYVNCLLDLQTMSFSNFDKSYSDIIAAYHANKIIKLKVNYYLSPTWTQSSLGDLRMIDESVSARVEFDALLMADLTGGNNPKLYHLHVQLYPTGNIVRRVNQITTTQIV